jgi:hypothetical protein
MVLTAHGEEASRLRRIAQKQVQELEELQVGWCDALVGNVVVVVVTV